ncbi:MAG: hypothetical protein Q9167_004275 [Letrouitia subvulpina]
MWVEAMRGKFEGGRRFEKKDWDQLLGHCMGVSDTPCYAFAEELISAYPDAKVILSVRDNAEVWKKSVEDTILTVVRKMQVPSPLARFFKLFLPHDPLAQYGSMVVKYTRLMDIPWDYKRIYNDHNAWIRGLVPPERLLVFNCKEGWEPLCKFLEKDVPEKPFPRRNDQVAYHENIRLLEEKMGMQALKNMIITFGSVTGFAAASWFAWGRLAM